MSSEISIKVENLSKCYHIYDQPRDRLKQFLMPRLRRSVGLPQRQYFREFWALKDVSFEVKRGETVGIIGRNGSGKSTILQMICGTLNPTGGSVQTYGRIAALLELGSGFNPEFTGRENVYMNAAVLGLTKDEIDQRFDDIVAFADIGEFLDQPVKTYSSGMYVRLAFAVIAHVDASILVIDEALAVGDIFFTQKCMRFLGKFKKEGTILFVTHDTNSVLALCDKALWLQAGERLAFGSAKDVCEAYLAEYYAERHLDNELPKPETKQLGNDIAIDYADLRSDFVNRSNLRNDLEVFVFDENSRGFGDGAVKVEKVLFRDIDRGTVSWFVGGEIIELKIIVRTQLRLDKPIVGFLVKDRHGQHLFGDNTYIQYKDCFFQVEAGFVFSATFRFRMPILPTGDYTVGVAVANGMQDKHVIQSWVHDAITFRSHSSSVATGLLGIPMLAIGLKLDGK